MDENFSTIESVWSPYDPERDGGCGGIYLVLFRPFKNVPYYVGETGRFSKRFAEHDKFYREGKRTFFRPPFIDAADELSHRGFVHRRTEIVDKKMDNERGSYLYVPGKEQNSSISDESLSFKTESVTRLVWKIATTKAGRQSLERRVQEDLKSYYRSLIDQDVILRVPGGSSELYGKQSGSLAAPLRYSVTPKEIATSPTNFFKEIEATILPGQTTTL